MKKKKIKKFFFFIHYDFILSCSVFLVCIILLEKENDSRDPIKCNFFLHKVAQSGLLVSAKKSD